jgi:hypothetical protein
MLSLTDQIPPNVGPQDGFRGSGDLNARAGMLRIMTFRGVSRSMGLLAMALVTACTSATPPTATLAEPLVPEAPTTIVYPSITPPAPPPTVTTLPPTTVPVAINGLVPKSDQEREVLVAADQLFTMLKQNLYREFVDDEQLLPIYVEPMLSRNRRFLQTRRERHEIDRRGDIQVRRFRSLRQQNTDRWIVVVCSEDNGALVRTHGTSDPSDDEVVNTGLGGSVIQFELQATPIGWRFADGRVIDDFEGTKCGE